MTEAGERMEKLDPPCLAGGTIKRGSAVNAGPVGPRKMKRGTAIRASSSASGDGAERSDSDRRVRTVLTAALLTKTKRWEQPKRPSTEDGKTKRGLYRRRNLIQPSEGNSDAYESVEDPRGQLAR